MNLRPTQPPSQRQHGLVIGKFYPFHLGHVHLIERALESCERVTVEVLGASVESLSLDERMQWVREAFPVTEFPQLRVVGAMDDAEVDYASDDAWNAHMQVIEGLLDSPVDTVLSGDAYGQEMATRLAAEWIRVDRREVPITGRAIRAELAARWHELPPSTQRGLGFRVVVLGAESTGSTTLALDLAEHTGAPYVAEYGRLYSEIREGGFTAPWRPEEFAHIVDQQIADEQDAVRTLSTPFIVCDTDVLATALWFERYVGEPSPEILTRAAAHPPALYVLTGDEIPFVQDGLRDGEHIRHAHQERFRETLAAQQVPWIEVHGTPHERLQQTLDALAPIAAERATFAEPLEERGVDSTSLLS